MGKIDISLLPNVLKRLDSALYEFNDILGTLVDNIRQVKKNIAHVHAAHEHTCCHSFSGITDHKNYNDPYFKICDQKCFETKFYPDLAPYAVYVLMREMSEEWDCDNNGEIFTKDFIFDNNDTTVPILLRNIQRIHTHDETIIRYTWDQYLATVSQYLYK